MNKTLDLTKQAPRSPYETLEGFAILGRTIDKCRAFVVGKNGEYHFDCPVDKMLWAFTGVKAEDFKKRVSEGQTEAEIAAWVKATASKSDAEIKTWSEHFKTDYSYSTDPAKKGWFIGECNKYGLDPHKTTLFDYLLVDDRATFKTK